MPPIVFGRSQTTQRILPRTCEAGPQMLLGEAPIGLRTRPAISMQRRGNWSVQCLMRSVRVPSSLSVSPSSPDFCFPNYSHAIDRGIRSPSRPLRKPMVEPESGSSVSKIADQARAATDHVAERATDTITSARDAVRRFRRLSRRACRCRYSVGIGTARRRQKGT
jgi:hypothetical protein